MAGMDAFYHDLPKAELHLHLEGAVEPETLREIEPDLPLEEIRAHYLYEDFQGFLRSYEWVIERLHTPEHYALITRRLLERLERENVRYAEIILSVGVMLWRNQDPAPIYEAVRARRRARPWRFTGSWTGCASLAWSTSCASPNSLPRIWTAA